MTIKLQSIGLTNSKPAGEFKEGDKMVFNFGETSTVLSITSISDKTVEILFTSGYKIRLRKSTQKGVA